MKNTKFKNALFINYGGIGDEILFLPAIEGFKKQYPDSKITLCLEPRAKGIKTLSPFIDDVISVDIKAGGIKKYINILKLIVFLWTKKFDIVISSGKSPFVSVILFLSFIKIKAGYKTKTSKLLNYEIPLNENCYAGRMYFDLVRPFVDFEFELPGLNYDKDFMLPSGVKEKEFILIHPGVSLMSVKKNIFKCPKGSFWIELIKELLNKKETVLLAGGPDDKNITDEIIKDEFIKNHKNFYLMFGKTKNLYEMSGLIKKSKKMICADSAPLHIGVALGVDIIALFGPTNEKKLVPEKENIITVTKNLNCRPCLWDKRLTNCESSECIGFLPEDVLNYMK